MIRKVVKTKKAERHAVVSEYFAHVLDMIAIQRSQGSSIPTTERQLISLKGKFKNVICNILQRIQHQRS
ncbi:SNF2-like protein [Penicillium samsonianum]|uniref:SNF2-like protein n=1 Tax=Penicillium samsonianum TaxID=1882272 RepID=UPI002549349C|nr:SNF2-like protein [Penicillium samsonianum]KAJ6137580.1 SNF2-like protein [Penicillium samsonianum]